MRGIFLFIGLTLLSGCDDAGFLDNGRFKPTMGGITLLDTRTGTLYQADNGKWVPHTRGPRKE